MPSHWIPQASTPVPAQGPPANAAPVGAPAEPAAGEGARSGAAASGDEAKDPELEGNEVSLSQTASGQHERAMSLCYSMWWKARGSNDDGAVDPCDCLSTLHPFHGFHS
jgi:hypothetical protein